MHHLPLHRAVWLFPAMLLPLMVAASHDFGATWDEELQQRRGEQLVDYYTGRAAELVVTEDGSHFYGAGFDVLAVGLQRLLPGDTYVVRHGLNAFIGWLGIVFCGLLAARLFCPATALLAMILLAITPRYFGHCMNNPKDIPFATLATATLYVLCRVSEQSTSLTWRHAAALALVLGLALNVRPGALLFLLYLLVLLLVRLQQRQRLRLRPVMATGAWLASITFVTLLVGSLTWPWALARPVIGPVLALAQLSHFGWNHTFLFMGRDVFALSPPWEYVPVWFAITLPPVVMAGLLLSLPLVRATSSRHGPAVALWAVVVFPVVYVIGVRAVIYDEVRHLLFVLPPMVVLAAAGWINALRARLPLYRGVAASLLIPGILIPLVFEIREHPNQVVYFNELIGGPRGAYGRYEMDYWGNCVLQALSRTAVLLPRHARPLRVSGWPVNILHMDASRQPALEITDPESASHQLTIVLARGRKADVIALAARSDILARVATTDGALLCAVLPGPAYAETFAPEQSRQAPVTPVIMVRGPLHP
jgi:hypothetical protein